MKFLEGWLIYRKKDAERNKHYITFYEAACHKRGVQITLLYFEDFSYGTASDLYLSYGGKPITQQPAFVIMRADVPDFSAHLEKMGYRVFNNARLSSIANDKFKTLQLAGKLGISVPDTRLATVETAREEAAILGYPLVMKPRDGHGGEGVLWVENEESLQRLLKDYNHASFLLQKPVSALGRDLRIYVVGGEIVAAMLRSREDDFRSNYCLGGNASRYELTKAETDIVHRLTETLDIGFAGIDLMFHEGRPVLNEMEDVVGARMLYHLTELDVVDMYIEHIVNRIQ